MDGCRLSRFPIPDIFGFLFLSCTTKTLGSDSNVDIRYSDLVTSFYPFSMRNLQISSTHWEISFHKEFSVLPFWFDRMGSDVPVSCNSKAVRLVLWSSYLFVLLVLDLFFWCLLLLLLLPPPPLPALSRLSGPSFWYRSHHWFAKYWIKSMSQQRSENVLKWTRYLYSIREMKSYLVFPGSPCVTN